VGNEREGKRREEWGKGERRKESLERRLGATCGKVASWR